MKRAIEATAVIVTLLLAITTGAVFGSNAAGAQGAAGGEVTIVHGLRGLLVDIYVDGDLLLEAFEPDRVTDPLELAPGSYFVELRRAGSASDSEPFFDVTLDVAGGDRLAVVAHYDPRGEPTVSAFPRDLRPVDSGESRFVFHNTAAFATVDIVIDGETAVDELQVSEQRSTDLAAATYAIGAVGTDDASVVVPDNDVAAQEGSVQFLYLVSSPDSTNVTWLAETIGGVQTPPAAVNTGNSGLVAADAHSTTGRTPVLLAAVLVPAVAMLVARDRTRPE